MAEADELLDAVLANQAATEPRLVYADWLLDQGEPWGEYIALACRLPNEHSSLTQRRKLHARSQQLLREHGPRWLAPLQGMGVRYRMDRGFVSMVALPLLKYALHRDWLRRQPIAHLGLRTWDVRRLGRLLGWDELARLRSLQVSTSSHERIRSRRALKPITQNPWLRNLRLLQLDMRLDDPAVWALRAPGVLPGLQELDLSSAGLEATGLEVLAVGDLFRRLRRIDLSHNAITLRGARALRHTRDACQLRELCFERTHQDDRALVFDRLRADWGQRLKDGRLDSPFRDSQRTSN